MAISKTHAKKSPSQLPNGFYESKQQGGAYGSPQNVPDVMRSGTMREKIYGRKDLGKSK